jgi:5-methyltetrahydrofolate--homocysteine methyltransferase
VPDLSDLRTAILTGNAKSALTAAREALGRGAHPVELVSEAISPAMDEAGRRFEAGDFFVPELLIAARATKGVFDLIRPLLAETGAEPAGRVVLGTVQGDLHDIGKNLVATMLEGGGFEVIDLGVDVPTQKFVAAVADQQPTILALSALLTTTMPGMKTTLEALRGAGLRERVRVMVGGAPVTQAFADAIGADGYRPNAASVVELARQLLGGA